MVDLISAGDTAWILGATILVLLMSVPGIAFFYGGLTKKKNVLNSMFLALIAFAIASVIWVVYGYSFAFGDTSLHGLIAAPANFLMMGIGIDDVTGTIPTILFAAFQLTFAGLTAALISGSIVGRMKAYSWMIFTIAWIPLVYTPVAHGGWGGGWLMQMGARDFAGGTVVHINCGVTALGLAVVLGKRKDTSLLPHNLGYSILGAGFLWFGWMGFNGGSALAANGLAASAILVSNVAAAVAMITWILIDTYRIGKPTVLGAITGAVAGLVAITPAAGFVDVPAAIFIGFVTSFVSYFAIYVLKSKLGYDDALDVFGVHGLSGVWGAIATGIFASPAINEAAGLVFGNPSQVTVQIISIIVTAVYAGLITLILAKALDKTIGLRVDERTEVDGLDSHLHEESGYRL